MKLDSAKESTIQYKIYKDKVKNYTDSKLHSNNIFIILSEDQDAENYTYKNLNEKLRTEVKNSTEQNPTTSETIDQTDWNE